MSTDLSELTLPELPTEIRLKILQDLRLSDILTLCQVCKAWADLFNDDQTWTHLYMARWPDRDRRESTFSKETYHKRWLRSHAHLRTALTLTLNYHSFSFRTLLATQEALQPNLNEISPMDLIEYMFMHPDNEFACLGSFFLLRSAKHVNQDFIERHLLTPSKFYSDTKWKTKEILVTLCYSGPNHMHFQRRSNIRVTLPSQDLLVTRHALWDIVDYLISRATSSRISPCTLR
eukprot:TRINITY_DN14988_c0_g1::TRINITY_DN14988_c0_g1_i1::g.25870::m.25870 TRINITY_DN14988_c0_g1::TRINITY_DN14988_c0_g1_i1::g.25870  ORF type:complete len:233 (-),score=15.89,F-box-like/PF12937.2/4.1e-11,F-box/PF00646.28/8.5e-08 TRINITY_DN14988_c0_g1_i1:4-702(-)